MTDYRHEKSIANRHEEESTVCMTHHQPRVKTKGPHQVVLRIQSLYSAKVRQQMRERKKGSGHRTEREREIERRKKSITSETTVTN